MASHYLTFDAIDEPRPGPKWIARWKQSWPAYQAWFRSHGGDDGPDRVESEAALAKYMPELVPVHRELTALAGGSDRASRFLSTWCPPRYLGGCSIAALAHDGQVRLVRNYDLAPDLNEGLLLRSEWSRQPVMGMVEFLWGLSDGVNAAGVAIAIAYGGRKEVAPGFGVTTIVRYVLETCENVDQALAVLHRVPSHMAYNVTLADRHGMTTTVELLPGGGARIVGPAIATNHQQGDSRAENPIFSRTVERHHELFRLLSGGIQIDSLSNAFLVKPLFQDNYDAGFGTLFTAVYDPVAGGLSLRWPGEEWRHTLDAFVPGSRTVRYAPAGLVSPSLDDVDFRTMLMAIRPYLSQDVVQRLDRWAETPFETAADWIKFGEIFSPLHNRE